MIALDTTALSILFVDGATVCRHGSKVPIKYARERLDAFVDRIANNHEQILISTPALSEVLVKVPADRINGLIAQLNSSAWFRVESFDSAAAIEAPARLANAISKGDKREGLPKETPWTKIKLDRQIVSVALVNFASEIISDDPDIAAIGDRWGFKVSSIEDLPIPDRLIPPPLFAALEESLASVPKEENA
jgi:hypothetical protein